MRSNQSGMKAPTLRQAQGRLSRARNAREMGHPLWLRLGACALLLGSQFASAQAEAALQNPAATQSYSSTDFAAARTLMQQGKVDEAIADLKGTEAKDPAANGLALELGTAYYKKSDFPNAIQYLKKASAEDPANQEAVQLLGMSYYAGGHPADAIPLLEKVQG